MKKTLLALSVAAFAANSAQAYTFVNSEETGTKLEFLGSARLQWRSSANKTDNYVLDRTTRNHVNHAVSNNGSRFGFRITQQLGNDFYALGRVEWRFRGTASSQHNFDDIYARQLYAGIGHKKYGELTYGNQTVITDEVKQTDLANTLSLSDGLLEYAARRSIQYVYKGVDGLKVGGFYSGSSKRNNSGLDRADKRKDTWGIAAIYNHKIDGRQSAKVGLGVTQERAYNSEHSVYDATAYSLGMAYTLDNITLGIDLERKTTKDQNVAGNKRTQKEVRTIALQKLTDQWSVYTMYAYKTDKLNAVLAHDTKAEKHQFMLGTEYYIVPKRAENPVSLKTFVEWGTSRTDNHTNGLKMSKVRDNLTVIGLRAYW